MVDTSRPDFCTMGEYMLLERLYRTRIVEPGSRPLISDAELLAYFSGRTNPALHADSLIQKGFVKIAEVTQSTTYYALSLLGLAAVSKFEEEEEENAWTWHSL